MKTYLIAGVGLLLLVGVLFFALRAQQSQQMSAEAATRAYEEQLKAPYETARAELKKLATPAR